MGIVGIPSTLNTQPYKVTTVRRIPRDVREDGKDKFVGEFENCTKKRLNGLAFDPKRLMWLFILRLVWGAGDQSMAGCCFLLSLVRGVGVFSRWRSMIL